MHWLRELLEARYYSLAKIAESLEGWSSLQSVKFCCKLGKVRSVYPRIQTAVGAVGQAQDREQFGGGGHQWHLSLGAADKKVSFIC